MKTHNMHNSPHLPLSDIHILELSGIGPIPYAGQLLSDLGASVTRIVKSGSMTLSVENRGKKQLELDLRQEESRATILDMVKTTDILIEGSRPGVAERLGLGPEECLAANPKLIYGRMTGWGQDGPWAHKAGHDINYIGLSGALFAMGDKDSPPIPPLNLVGDYGGGSMFLIMGILSALIARGTTGKGQVVDASIVDGTMSMLGIVHSLSQIGMWNTKRANNLLDGSRPYYRCYATQDGGYMAIGCLEPQFYTEMLKRLDIDEQMFGGQHDPALWDAQIQTLTACFATKSRTEWEKMFDTSDACVTPVLSYEEAPHHKQNKARHCEGTLTPPIAPKFSPQT